MVKLTQNILQRNILWFNTIKRYNLEQQIPSLFSVKQLILE